MADENVPPQLGQKRPNEDSALVLPPRKKAGPLDVWRRKGRHVGRVIHAFVNVEQLVMAGLQLDEELAPVGKNGIEKYPADIRRLYEVYGRLLEFLPQLEEGLRKETISGGQLKAICASIQEGVGNGRSDDVKTLKPAVVEWLTDPVKGLVPPLKPHTTLGRGFGHEATGKELCPAGLDWNDPSIKAALMKGEMTVASDQWPICFYQDGDYDPQHPWRRLLRGRLLVNAFKHVFNSPSSVDNEGRSTKASNAANHAMTKVTPASIAYIATIVRFCISDRPNLSQTDTILDSQNFYKVILGFITHPEEVENLNELLAWWDRQVFPHAVALYRAPTVNSALSRLLEDRKRRAAFRAIGQAN